jgi:hypothetical protein
VFVWENSLVTEMSDSVSALLVPFVNVTVWEVLVAETATVPKFRARTDSLTPEESETPPEVVVVGSVGDAALLQEAAPNAHKKATVNPYRDRTS